ncbi:hypothetical protein P7C70_g5404, partial [Phenoliferia sp. Uapishka_3]
MGPCRRSGCYAFAPHVAHRGTRPAGVAPIKLSLPEGEAESGGEKENQEVRAESVSTTPPGSHKRKCLRHSRVSVDEKVDVWQYVAGKRNDWDEGRPEQKGQEGTMHHLRRLQRDLDLANESERLLIATSHDPILRQKITPVSISKSFVPKFGSECSATKSNLAATYDVLLPSGEVTLLKIETCHHTIIGRDLDKPGEYVANISASLRSHRLEFKTLWLESVSEHIGRGEATGVKKFFLAFADALEVPVNPGALLDLLIPREVLEQKTPKWGREDEEGRGREIVSSTVREDLLSLGESNGRDVNFDWIMESGCKTTEEKTK